MNVWILLSSISVVSIELFSSLIESVVKDTVKKINCLKLFIFMTRSRGENSAIDSREELMLVCVVQPTVTCVLFQLWSY